MKLYASPLYNWHVVAIVVCWKHNFNSSMSMRTECESGGRQTSAAAAVICFSLYRLFAILFQWRYGSVTTPDDIKILFHAMFHCVFGSFFANLHHNNNSTELNSFFLKHKCLIENPARVLSWSKCTAIFFPYNHNRLLCGIVRCGVISNRWMMSPLWLRSNLLGFMAIYMCV